MKKKSWMISVMLAGMFCVPSAWALIGDFKLPADENVKVTVESTVTEISIGEYLYTYQIRDIGDLNISLLSIPFLTPLADGVEIYGFNSDGGAAPFYWDSIGNPAIAAQAYFISSPSPTLTFEFKSIYGAQTVSGYVNDAQLGSLYGMLLAPVPEPLTISLFAIGAGIIVRKKHKNKISNTESRRVI